jgi:aminopeptidase-like protein
MKLDSNDKYEVFIDSSFNHNGAMTIGEAYIKGESNKEILISTYICHPSMAINELSGPLVAAFMFNILNQKKKHKYSYRFLFIPETIGSIYNLSVYGEFWKKNLLAGFVVTCVGHNSSYTYKMSRDGNSLSDKAAETILKQQNENFEIIEFPG